MAETVLVIFKEDGAQRIIDNTTRIGQQMDTAGRQSKDFGNAVDYLKGKLELLAGAFAIDKLRQYADTYASLTSRLKLVADNTDQLRAAEERLFAISNQTRTSFESTLNLYARLANALKGTKTSQEDMLNITESINKAVTVSGATSQEAAQGLIQFSQGLASGTLRGDELRSVLEQFPYLAEQIAKGMGVSVAALRQLGQDGAITTQKITDALKKQAPEIQAAFSQMSVTVSQAFTVLQNNLLRWIGQMDQAKGVSSGFAQALLAVATNFDTIAKSIAVAVVAFGTLRAAMAVSTVYAYVTALAEMGRTIAAVNLATMVSQMSGAASGMSALALATANTTKGLGFFSATLVVVRAAVLGLFTLIAAHPFIAFATAVAAAVTYIYNFGNTIKLTADGSVTAFGLLKGVIVSVIEGLSNLLQWGNQLYQWLTKTKEGFTALITTMTILITYFTLMQVPTLIAWLTNLLFLIRAITVAMYTLVTNPIVLLVTAITGLVIAIAYWTGALDTLAIKMQEVGAQISNNLTAKIKEASAEGLKAGDNSLVMGDKMKTATQQAGQGFKQLKDDVKGAKEETKGLNDALDGTSAGAQKIRELSQAVQNLTHELQNAKAEATETKNKFEEFQKATKEKIEALEGKIKELTDAFKNLKNEVDELKDKVHQLELRLANVGSLAGRPGSGGGGGGGGDLKFSFQNPYWERNLIDAASRLSAQGYFDEAREKLTALYDYKYSIWGKAGPGGNHPEYYPQWYRDLKGFRTGGEFEVGGTGGPDSQLVQFMASPGETVSITPANQNNRKPTVVNITVNARDIESFRRSKTQILAQFGAELVDAMYR